MIAGAQRPGCDPLQMTAIAAHHEDRGPARGLDERRVLAKEGDVRAIREATIWMREQAARTFRGRTSGRTIRRSTRPWIRGRRPRVGAAIRSIPGVYAQPREPDRLPAPTNVAVSGKGECNGVVENPTTVAAALDRRPKAEAAAPAARPDAVHLRGVDRGLEPGFRAMRNL
jgi:hypothetical protein